MARRDLRSAVPLIHSLIAVAIFFVLISSWWMMALPLPSKVWTYRAIPFQLHKNVGLTVVVLVVVLLYGRIRYVLTRRSPAARLQGLSLIQHVLLYVLVLACCLSGYLSSAYSGWATRVWWLFSLPNWGGDNDQLNIFYSDIHSWTTYGLLAVVVVHVANAIYHAFRNDGLVRRMLRL
jgi:cytochrome b561